LTSKSLEVIADFIYQNDSIDYMNFRFGFFKLVVSIVLGVVIGTLVYV
jgi:hypothetical protein